ncbi:MAG TPA: aquaporin [Actinomycetota bacterium]|nr:aquaporin [Actinomycetota bacterium]
MLEPRQHAGDGLAEPPLPLERAAAAELLGSFTIVLFGAGSVVVAGSVGGGLVGVALATGFAFAAALAATMPLSAGGVNPALTVAFWVAGRLSTPRTMVYAAAQVVGAVLAGVVLRLGVPQPSWSPAALGAPLLAEGVGAGPGVLIEAVATFILTMVAFALFVDDRVRSAGTGALALGLLLAAATLFAWPLTGAALNPARAIGPEIAGGTWSDWWIYWIGPGAGAVIGAVVYWSVFLRERARPPTD